MGAGAPAVTACITTGFSSELFSTSDGIWLRALAGQVLAPAGSPRGTLPRERDTMHWLLGRVAAKGAVRPLGAGDPRAGAHAVGRCDPAGVGPAGCRLSHAGTVGSAARSGPSPTATMRRGAVCPAPGRVGIDLEFAPGRDEAVLASILSDDERALLQQAGGVTLAGLLFCWCAKEAAAKASGHAKGVVPYAWQLVAYAPPTAAAPRGHATVAHDGARFAVTLWREGDAQLALCHLPEFDPGAPVGHLTQPAASSAPPAR
ncbi:MAG: 4'-phosphopantetheinyl transferase superfamily protein [Caldilineaceae bacterium]